MTMGKALLGAVAICMASPASAQLDGNAVNCFRNGTACTSNNGTGSTAVVGNGVEFNRTTSIYDFNSSGLSFSYDSGGPNFSAITYSFANSTSPFISFNSLVVSGGFPENRVSLQKNRISFNLQGLSGTGGATLNLVTAASAAPEPGSWALMILGFGIVGYAMRRRRVTFGQTAFAAA